MFCTKCGTNLPDDAKFCYACGNKTAVINPVPQQTDTLNRSGSSVVTNTPAPVQNTTVSSVNENRLDPKKIVLGILWRGLVIVAAIILAGGISYYFDLFNANKEISGAIIGDYDDNGLATTLFVGTPYFVCIFVLLIFLGALMRNSMWYILPFIAYWVTPFFHEEINNTAFENMSDSIGAVCIYRATFYGLLTSEIESLCKIALIFLIPAFIINFIYNILYPKKSIISLLTAFFWQISGHKSL